MKTQTELNEETGEMKKQKGRPKAGRDDATTKFDRHLLGKAQMIARHRGIPVAEYLEEMTRAKIDRDYTKLLQDYEKKGTKD
jgi:hypothetical protein